MPDVTHSYQSAFFDYINAGSLASARVIAPIICRLLTPHSVLDVGCGAGAWCKVWKEAGVNAVVGVDGEYIDRQDLLFSIEDFHAQDLSKTFNLNSTFDIVASLEVAEHVPEEYADVFIDNLVRHGKKILFSAAVPGQGGEFHVNEQPLHYWRKKFAERGYHCFDPLRPQIVADTRVESWYRYNTLLYVSEDMIPALTQEVLASNLSIDSKIPEMAPIGWRARKAVIRSLPNAVINQLVKLKHAWVRRKISRTHSIQRTG